MKAVFNKRSGFMIVEILISLALAGLLVVTVVSVLAASRRLQNEGKLRQQALDYARQTLETVNANYYTEFGTSPWPADNSAFEESCESIFGQPFYRTVTVENIGSGAVPVNDLKKITTDVFWPTCGSVKKVSLSTIITAWKK